MATKKNKKRPSSRKRKPSIPIVNDFVELGKGTISMRLVSDPAPVQPRLDALEQQVKDLMSVTGGLWRMQDGTLMAIRQMSDNHLANALKLAKRAAPDLTTSIQNMEREQQRRKTDHEFASKDGLFSSSVEAEQLRGMIRKLENDLFTARAAGRETLAKLTGRLDALEARKTDTVSGREMAQVKADISALQTTINTPVWDGKEQVHVTLADQVKRLTRRIFDMEQENKKLRAATTVEGCKMNFAEALQACGRTQRQPTEDERTRASRKGTVDLLLASLKAEVAPPPRIGTWHVSSRGYRIVSLVDAIISQMEGL